MWNKSGSNWGDDPDIKTAEEVISNESNSGNLKLYLAIDNDEVVGYCSFSEYEYDEGASYLPLINVSPDYQGKKVGKALILKVVEDAVNSKWPRFDLFTWSGNIKAMPLYKKCGFFWEKKNSSVHLMNFIPYLYQTEALKDYLKDIDWYKDSKRIIDMNQDGEEINHFDYFRYDFENDKTKLAFEFERTGRGLRLIETPDYSIEMSIPKYKPVFNNNYLATFKIINKSKKDLVINLIGKDNKMIKANFKETIKVLDEVIIEKPFFVGKTNKVLDKMRTYPVLETDIYINSKKATFKIGLEPKSPLETELKIVDYTHFINKTHIGYLELENNLDERTDFILELPNTKINVLKPIYITLDPLEKRSLELKYLVNEFGFYDEDILITYNSKTIKRPLKGIIKGLNHAFTAECNDKAYIINGSYMGVYSLEHHSITYSNNYKQNFSQVLGLPQVGLPYSLEFSNEKPKITFPNTYSMDISFKSNAFRDVYVIIHVVNQSGVLKVNYELLNKGPKRTLALAFTFWVSVNNTYVPFNKKLLLIDKNDSAYLGNIANELIDENWMYNNEFKSGITWDKEENVYIDGWKIKSSKEGIVLKTNESYSTKDYYISYVHSSVNEFRKFAGNTVIKDEMKFIELNLNNGNPFSTTNSEAQVTNHKKVTFEGDFICDDAKSSVNEILEVSPGLKEFQIDLPDQHIKMKRQLYKLSGDIKQVNDNSNLIVDNGILSFKSNTLYNDSIYSLVFNGHEWLDSNYPEPKSRAWWGFFIGGISFRKHRIENLVLLKEPRTAEFVSLEDNFGNKWQGIKTTVSFTEAEEYKGLVVENYSLTLPGVPLIHSFSNVINNTGKLISNSNFHRYNTLRCDDDLTKVTVNVDGIKLKCHNIGFEKATKKLLQFSSTRENKLAIYNKSNDLEVDTQKQYTICFSMNKLTIPDGGSKQFSGDFYIFTKDSLVKEHLKDLENIKFNI